MAMITNPEVLIADEPTTALDAQIQMEIIELIKQLKITYRCSVLFISHDLSLVHSFADYIYVMRNGKIEEKELLTKYLMNQKSNILSYL